jgi:hypothetical protein
MAAGDPGVLKRNFSATAIETTLVNSISSAATGDTTTSVSVVSVSGYPAVPFTLILAPDTNKEEVVTCISVVGTTLQIIRGQDSTLAVSHTAGTSVRHGVSGRDFREEQTHIAARGYDADTAILSNAGQTHVHGLETGDGSVVGSTQLVTLTRKTLTTPTINGATISGAFTSTATITGGTVTAATITSSTVTSSTITSGTLGSNLAAGGFLVTGLGAPASDNDAARKIYVDSILGSATSAAASATAAAASAATAATSAASAATFATNSSNSATASASSASASATSATASATSATLSASSASASATSASAAATSATNAAASATTAAASVAAIAAYSTTASNSASAAATSATSAALSASAAATSATSAAASATTASNSAATATTQAGNASASATAAATSATAAATSATSAAASATAAATSATNAATSASSALTSQTAAATSAADAATSASSAATTYDQFDDRYLGSKTSDPTLDNDGNALLTGALYFNSVISALKVYTGSAWVLVAPDTSNFIDKSILTAKGTIISASTASTPVALTAAATNGYLLSVSSSTTSGLAWTAPPVDVLSLNLQTLVSDYTIDAGYNAHSVGPVTIDTGITITIPSGATWLIN